MDHHQIILDANLIIRMVDMNNMNDTTDMKAAAAANMINTTMTNIMAIEIGTRIEIKETEIAFQCEENDLKMTPFHLLLPPRGAKIVFHPLIQAEVARN